MPRLKIGRAIAIVATGLLILWISVGVTLTLTLGSKSPTTALAVWPWGSLAKVTLASESLIGEPPSAEVAARSRQLFRDGALRSPIDPDSLAGLAILDDMADQKDRARRLFRLSETLSRRTLLTQIWLTQDAVDRGSVSDAIDHYNRTMSVSIPIRSTLLPILVTAADDSVVRRKLVSVLANRPPWWQQYILQLAEEGNSIPSLVDSTHAVRLNIRDGEEIGIASNVVKRIIALHGHREAIRLANWFEGKQGDVHPLLSGNFEREDGVLPFAWWFQSDGDARAYRERVPNGSFGLWIMTKADASGGVAQQLLGLTFGRHILSGTAGGVPSGRLSQPIIEIACPDGRKISSFSLPPSNGNGARFQFAFSVPTDNCEVQWLNFASSSAFDSEVWIDDLSISS